MTISIHLHGYVHFWDPKRGYGRVTRFRSNLQTFVIRWDVLGLDKSADYKDRIIRIYQTRKLDGIEYVVHANLVPKDSYDTIIVHNSDELKVWWLYENFGDCEELVNYRLEDGRWLCAFDVAPGTLEKEWEEFIHLYFPI